MHNTTKTRCSAKRTYILQIVAFVYLASNGTNAKRAESAYSHSVGTSVSIGEITTYHSLNLGAR